MHSKHLFSGGVHTHNEMKTGLIFLIVIMHKQGHRLNVTCKKVNSNFPCTDSLKLIVKIKNKKKGKKYILFMFTYLEIRSFIFLDNDMGQSLLSNLVQVTSMHT